MHGPLPRPVWKRSPKWSVPFAASLYYVCFHSYKPFLSGNFSVTFPRQESLPPFPLGAHICNKLLSFLLSIHMPTSSFYSDPRPCFLPSASATLTGCLAQHFRHNSWYKDKTTIKALNWDPFQAKRNRLLNYWPLNS